MHTAYRTIVAASLALSIAACDRTDGETQPVATEAPATSASSASSPASIEPAVELPFGSGAPEPFPIVPGSFVSGEFKSPRSGSLMSLAVQIGNYANSADGNLSIGVCQGERCTSGQGGLVGSADNQYLEVALEPKLEINETEAVTYRLIKDGGSSPVAVWLYPADAEARITVNNDAKLERAPKIALRFSR